MYFARVGKPLTSQEKEIDQLVQPGPSKVYFETIQEYKIGDFKKVLKWAEYVMNMYGEDLKFFMEETYLGKDPSFVQTWKYWTERKPIFVNPDFKASELNALYSRVKHEIYGGELKFNSYPDENGKTVYTSQNEDIVSHETGHAFLDIIRPDFYTQQRFQTQAIHESFGDLTCLFYHLSQPEKRLQVLKETGGDLCATSFLTLIAEPLNKGTKYGELRNLINDKKMGQTACEGHDLSNVFSAAIYELLEELFNALKIYYSQYSLAEILDIAQKALRRFFLQAVIEIPYSNPSFSDIGKHMKQNVKNWKVLPEIGFAEKIQEIFSKRGIIIEKPHTEDDDICKINLHQPDLDQSVRPFCTTFKGGFSYMSN